MLKGKNILLGITGSIAAYKSVDLAKKLAEEGADVTVIMTEAACRFVPPMTFETVLGKPVYIKPFEGHVKHISLARNADVLIIAPATANTINKLACGIADNLLCTLWLAYKGPAFIAPAMNSRMYGHPVVQKSLRNLSKTGVSFIGPASGILACGEEGTGRMSETADIVEHVRSALTPKDLKGHNILVTAGPTREPLDPVRFISNRSSGKMGYAVAAAALRRGADVTLVSGPVCLRPPKGAGFIPVERAVEMQAAVLKNLSKATSVIMTAAVSDFAPSVARRSKLPKSKITAIDLEKTPDILSKIGRKKNGRFIIGFSAETSKNTEKAAEKLKQKNLDLIVLNNISQKGAGFDADTNIVTLIDKKGKQTDHPLMKKEEVADIILNRLPGPKKVRPDKA
ncbi:coenzyme A biosynthesis bifunctional protein CoaBC [bacterium BMS3Abin10]|nr:coenzyme A biosynthesis bifunctional protein CoaBC [bacterium BMS3Abin10]